MHPQKLSIPHLDTYGITTAKNDPYDVKTAGYGLNYMLETDYIWLWTRIKIKNNTK